MYTFINLCISTYIVLHYIYNFTYHLSYAYNVMMLLKKRYDIRGTINKYVTIMPLFYIIYHLHSPVFVIYVFSVILPLYAFILCVYKTYILVRNRSAS